MSRIDAALLDHERYPFHHQMTTRFADLDAYNHINNVALAAAFEDARARFDKSCGLSKTFGRLRVLIAANHIDYLGEGYYPDPLDMYVGVLAMGRTSWTLGCLAMQNGRHCGFAKAVMVAAGPDGSTPFPQPLRDVLETVQVRNAK